MSICGRKISIIVSEIISYRRYSFNVGKFTKVCDLILKKSMVNRTILLDIYKIWKYKMFYKLNFAIWI